nr:uncharacterized protein LOC115844019 [Globicephala melas]
MTGGAGFLRERPSAADSPAARSSFSATRAQPLPGPGARARAGASAHPRPVVRAAGCLGAACCTAAPTADGHVSVPFFFFSPSPSAPFHRTALSFPPPAPFPTAGAVEKGVGEGWGREDAGAGQRSSPAPGEGRGCTATAPLPHAPRRDTLRARGCQCRQPVSPASACARRVPSRNRAREKGLKEESLFNDTAGSGYKHQKLQKEDRQLHGRLHEDGKVGHKYNSHSSKTSLRKIHMTMRHTWRVPSNIYLDGWTGPTASQQPGGEGEGRRWALRAPG